MIKKLLLSACVFFTLLFTSHAQIITTVAGYGYDYGTGAGGYSGDGGQATSAKLYFPRGITVDNAGNFYFVDGGNNVIRKVNTSTGIITTFAGNKTAIALGDGGAATDAQIYALGILCDKTGNLYIADNQNYRIRKVDSNGIITTVVGTGVQGYAGDGGSALNAKLFGPSGITFDTGGNMFFTDGNAIRRVDAVTGIISHISGSYSGNGSSGDGGPATAAYLGGPNGIAFDSHGNMFIADQSNNRIRKIDTAGIINTFYIYQIDAPMGLIIDGADNIYFADFGNNLVKKLDPSANMTRIAGFPGPGGYGGDGGQANQASLWNPYAVALDQAGNLYITDENNNSVRKVACLNFNLSTSNNASICNGSSIILSANGAASYTWTSPTTTTITSAGSYTVSPSVNTTYTLTGSTAGCAATKYITVYVNPIPSVSLTASSSSLCLGNTTTLTATGASSYFWSGTSVNTSTLALSPTANASYTVTGYLGTCSAVQTISISVTPTPTLNFLGLNPLCVAAGYTTPISITVNGATTYTWSANAGSANTNSISVSPTVSTVYTVSGSNATCGTNPISYSVNVGSSLPLISITGPDTVCTAATAITLTATGAQTYTWGTGVFKSNYQGAVYTDIYGYGTWHFPPGIHTYTVTGKDSIGCINRATHTVNFYQPNLSVSSMHSGSSTSSDDTLFICQGIVDTLIAHGGQSYNWHTWWSGQVLASNTATLATTGSYGYYTVTGTGNLGCPDTLLFAIFPQAPYISVSKSKSVLCTSGIDTLRANGASTWQWSTGQTSNSVVVNYPGIYTVTGADADGCKSTASIIVTDTCNRVWPGDANEDLVVDNTDLLILGLKYGKTGYARDSSMMNNYWHGYTCLNWNDTLSTGKNTKYADCNGDGTINMNDTLAINLNYNLTHTERIASPHIVQTTNPDIFLTFNKPLYFPGDTVIASVNMGSAANIQNNFYGAAFTVQYDNSKVQSGTEKFWFNNSWVGIIDHSKVKFSKLNTATGIVDASLVRITNTDTMGYGKVASLQFVLQANLSTSELYVTVSNAIKTNHTGINTPLNTGTDSVSILQAVTGIRQITSGGYQVSVWPNPALNTLQVAIAGNKGEAELQITNIIGQEVYKSTIQQPNHTTIDISNLTNGVYFVTITNGVQSNTRKIVVNH